MADSDSTAAAVAGAIPLVGQVFNAFSQGAQNRKTREWNEQMYDKQKRDNLEFWGMQNSYNSPEQQMQRMQKAGLNPALMYGNGTASAGNSTSAPDTPNAMPYRPDAPTLNLPQVVDSYYNMQTQVQRLSNEKQMGNNLAADALIKTEDAKSKAMLNDYMASKGYKYRGETERNRTNLTFEDYLAKNAQNAFNFGGDLKDANGIAHIDEGSAYSLQAMTMKIMNDLRNTAIQGNKYDNKTKKIRSDTEERFRKGRVQDMSAKDWLQLVLPMLKR